MSLTLSDQEKRVLHRLKEDLPYFASRCLRIVTKEGKVEPLVFNEAQMYLHNQAEKQLAEMGKVRLVICKGRQQGCSTYIAARKFHKALFKANKSIYILAHQAESTKWLYSIVKRYYENLPDFFKFPLVKDTDRAMEIDNGSVYSVGTAGSAQIGRGFTVQFLHASEVAFYENTDQLSTGLMQAVADVPGTEVFIESTANGPGNFFHSKVLTAMAKTTDYRLVFIPWYWQKEYTASSEGMELTPKEHKIYEAYHKDGMTLNHIAWRRKKIAEEDGKEWKVDQEYPNNIEEAFVRADGRFMDIPKMYAAKARNKVEDQWAPLIIGVDPGRTGDDTVICRRVGRHVFPFETIKADDGYQRQMKLAGILANIIEQEQPDQVFIDPAEGGGAIDRLHELGYNSKVSRIHFGSGVLDDQYLNKRVEMAHLAKDWFDNDDVSIPDDQEFISDLAAIPEARITSSGRKSIVSKDEIKKDLKRSPNKGDSFFLTFAMPVRKKQDIKVAKQMNSHKSVYKSCLNTMKVLRNKS